MCVEVRGQLRGVSALLLPLNLGPGDQTQIVQLVQQASLSTEPCNEPSKDLFAPENQTLQEQGSLGSHEGTHRCEKPEKQGGNWLLILWIQKAMLPCTSETWTSENGRKDLSIVTSSSCIPKAAEQRVLPKANTTSSATLQNLCWTLGPTWP